MIYILYGRKVKKMKEKNSTKFRVERTKDYTVMSNHHLRNRNLSMKAKGLLSLILSLSEDWEYSIRGLAKICKEGEAALCSTLNELETQGYITRTRQRDEKGRLGAMEYIIYESPKKRENTEIKPTPPTGENPGQGNHVLESPHRVPLIRVVQSREIEAK